MRHYQGSGGESQSTILNATTHLPWAHCIHEPKVERQMLCPIPGSRTDRLASGVSFLTRDAGGSQSSWLRKELPLVSERKSRWALPIENEISPLGPAGPHSHIFTLRLKGPFTTEIITLRLTISEMTFDIPLLAQTWASQPDFYPVADRAMHHYMTTGLRTLVWLGSLLPSVLLSPSEESDSPTPLRSGLSQLIHPLEGTS